MDFRNSGLACAECYYYAVIMYNIVMAFQGQRPRVFEMLLLCRSCLYTIVIFILLSVFRNNGLACCRLLYIISWFVSCLGFKNNALECSQWYYYVDYYVYIILLFLSCYGHLGTTAQKCSECYYSVVIIYVLWLPSGVRNVIIIMPIIIWYYDFYFVMGL